MSQDQVTVPSRTPKRSHRNKSHAQQRKDSPAWVPQAAQNLPSSPGSHSEIHEEQRVGHPRGLVREPGSKEGLGLGLRGNPGPGQQNTSCYKPQKPRGSRGVGGRYINKASKSCPFKFKPPPLGAANETQHSEIPCANWVRLAGQLPGNLCVSSHLAEAKTGGSPPLSGATYQVNQIKEEWGRDKPQQLEVSTLDA